MGAPIEFQDAREPENYVTKYMSGGAHNVTKGEFTDDMSMALAIADALIVARKFDPHLTMRNFLRWKNQGAYSPRGKMFDCGNTVFHALQKYEKDKTTPFVGDTGKFAAGNGGLMRLAPAIIFARNEEDAITLARETTRLTHGAEEALFYSEIFAQELYSRSIKPELAEYKHSLDINRKNVMSGGYVKETYQAAWWAFQTTDNFEDCIIKAINRGHDSDTTGAVAGMIAGMFYGRESIPLWMIEGLQWNIQIQLTTIQLKLRPNEFTNWLENYFFDHSTQAGQIKTIFGRQAICINPSVSYGGGERQLWAIKGTEAQLTTNEYSRYVRGRCLDIDGNSKSLLFKANRGWPDENPQTNRWIPIDNIKRYDANWY
jgi:ADP-ribosyl-[dinitrogen reductase] hydrolase